MSRSSIWVKPALAILPSLAWAQSLAVYSEFQRIGPGGEVVAPDRSATSREILSPAVARNGYASYHLVASVPPRHEYQLYVGQNPDDAVRVTVYREVHQRQGTDWIPDRLAPATLPVSGKTGDRAEVHVFWLDLWVSGDAPVRRIKVEPQLGVGDQWIVYPMEVRVTAAQIPRHAPTSAVLPGLRQRADAAVYGPLESLLCGTREPKPATAAALSIRSLIRRNALQDMALAEALLKRQSEPILAGLLAPTGIARRDEWCTAVTISAPAGLPAEWYLRARDFLYRTALH